jgi:hypothetical protein
MATPIDIVGEPGKPPGERRREHVDLGRGVDGRASRGWQLIDLSDGSIGDE